MYQDALETGHVTNPWHHAVILLGVRVLGIVAELGRFCPTNEVSSIRDCRESLDFLFAVVELAILL